jgi:hypothetical protein
MARKITAKLRLGKRPDVASGIKSREPSSDFHKHLKSYYSPYFIFSLPPSLLFFISFSNYPLRKIEKRCLCKWKVGSGIKPLVVFVIDL